MKKILITGATGNLGRLTIKHLLSTKNIPASDIAALVRDESRASFLSDQHIELRVGTYDDIDSLKQAFADVEKLLVISSPNLDNAERLRQQYNVVIAAYESKVQHIHLVSLADAEKRVFGLEDVDMATEHMILALNMPYTFLQNGVYLDEIRYSVKSALKTGHLLSTTQNRKFNYVLRNDLALANATVLAENKHKNKVYRLVSPELINYEQIAKELSDLTGKSIDYETKNEAAVIGNLVEAGVQEEVATQLVSLFQNTIAEDLFTSTSDDLIKLIGPQKSSLKESLSSFITE